MAPFRFAGARGCLEASALKARGANVLRAYLQIAQGAYEASATVAAGLKGFVWMKEAGGLVGHCGGRARAFAHDGPGANLHFLPAEGTRLPFRRRRNGIEVARTTGTGDSKGPGRRKYGSRRGAGCFGTALRESEQVDIQTHAQPRL